MVVYIEYALIENFLIDHMLLYLALFAAKRKIYRKRLVLAALLGAAFAVAFPLLSLPTPADYAVKFAFASFMVAVAFGRGKGKAERKAFVFTLALFFAFSFAFAGLLFALLSFAWVEADAYELSRAPVTLALCGGVAFVLAVVKLVKRTYEKRALTRFLYDCVIKNGEKSVAVQGYLDSGNCATKNGAPVCFLSPEIVYELWGESAFGFDEELCITTVSGEKTVRLFKGTLCVLGEEKEVYFSPAANMISREYKLLLHSRVLERRETE